MGGCEQLQGKPGGWVRLSAAVNGGACKKTGWRRSVEMKRNIFVCSELGGHPGFILS